MALTKGNEPVEAFGLRESTKRSAVVSTHASRVDHTERPSDGHAVMSGDSPPSSDFSHQRPQVGDATLAEVLPAEQALHRGRIQPDSSLPLPIPVRIKPVALQPSIDLLRILGIVRREAANVAARCGELSGELVASRHTRSVALAGRSCGHVFRHRRGGLEDSVDVRALDLSAIPEL